MTQHWACLQLQQALIGGRDVTQQRSCCNTLEGTRVGRSKAWGPHREDIKCGGDKLQQGRQVLLGPAGAQLVHKVGG